MKPKFKAKPLENKEIKDILTPTPLQSADQQLLEK